MKLNANLIPLERWSVYRGKAGVGVGDGANVAVGGSGVAVCVGETAVLVTAVVGEITTRAGEAGTAVGGVVCSDAKPHAASKPMSKISKKNRRIARHSRPPGADSQKKEGGKGGKRPLQSPSRANDIPSPPPKHAPRSR
ncbi:MAG: hypothetical protein M5U34_42780 [Chloroflexi bacterium]|nr:hypothetical protein [Chloroflexota bacterium]